MYNHDSLCIIYHHLVQWKSLEATLAGALRRERTAETTIRQLEAEIEQLNRLVYSLIIVKEQTLKIYMKLII